MNYHGLKRLQQGFTLVEIAIVLLIVGILLGYAVALFPVQQELKQYRQANREIDDAIAQLIAFAQVNGRLPCPDTSSGPGVIDGLEDPDGPNECEAYYGFLPARTLGMYGDYDGQNVLLDPWGEGYRYAVSEADAGDGDVDLITANGIRVEGMAAVIPDLFICDDSNATGDDDDCTEVSGNEVMPNVAAVVLSTGKDRGLINSNIQQENTDDFHDGDDDKVYIFAGQSDRAGAEFDDVVKWMSRNRLFSKMIEAEQLP